MAFGYGMPVISVPSQHGSRQTRVSAHCAQECQLGPREDRISQALHSEGHCIPSLPSNYRAPGPTGIQFDLSILMVVHTGNHKSVRCMKSSREIIAQPGHGNLKNIRIQCTGRSSCQLFHTDTQVRTQVSNRKISPSQSAYSSGLTSGPIHHGTPSLSNSSRSSCK